MDEKTRNWKKIIIRSLIIFVILALIALGIYYYFREKRIYPSTNDAYVHAHILNVAAQVSGQTQTVLVRNLSFVKKGQLLLTINPKPYEYALEKAQSQLTLAKQKVQKLHTAIETAHAIIEERKSHLADISGNTKRILALSKKGFASKQETLNAKTQLSNAKALLRKANADLRQTIIAAGEPESLNAEVKKAGATLKQAKLNLSHTSIYAPSDGTIMKLKIRPGAWITQGIKLFAIIEADDWWIDANYKETSLHTIKVGMPATITLSMLPNHTFKGYVARISRGSGAAFALFPPENVLGNWVSVTRRFPVHIKFLHIDPSITLRAGASASVTINTTTLKHET